MSPFMKPEMNIDVPDGLLEKAITSSPYGYVITDTGQTDNPVIFVNKAFQQITGYEANEVLGRNCDFLLRKDTDQSSLDKIRDAVKKGHRFTAVVRNYKKDGSLFYNELTIVSTLKDKSGKEAYRIWSLRDVTDSIEAQREFALQLTEKDKRFSAYMENSNEAIWRIDFDPPISIEAPESTKIQEVFNNGIFREANDEAARIYGYAKGADIRGRSLKEFMDESDPVNIKIVAELVRNNFLMDSIITRETSSDGTIKSILNNIKPLIQDSKVSSIWGASLDVSTLVKAQESLKRSKKKLKKQKNKLEKKNIALKELIVHVELDKKEFKDQILANIQHLVLPSLDKITLNESKEEYIEQHRKTLENLTSSFGQKLSEPRIKLSPREIEVCNFVKNGLSNKEISRLLNIALHTVEKHRRMARKKLGLSHKGINLRTYLNSL